MGYAKNKAISQSRGKFLCFQDAVSDYKHVKTCFIFCWDVFYNIHSGESKLIRPHVQYIIHSHTDLGISLSVWQRCQDTWLMTWEQCLTCVCFMCMYVHMSCSSVFVCTVLWSFLSEFLKSQQWHLNLWSVFTSCSIFKLFESWSILKSMSTNKLFPQKKSDSLLLPLVHYFCFITLKWSYPGGMFSSKPFLTFFLFHLKALSYCKSCPGLKIQLFVVACCISEVKHLGTMLLKNTVTCIWTSLLWYFFVHQDDVMLPQRVRLQYEASLLHLNSVSSPLHICLLTSFPTCCTLPSLSPFSCFFTHFSSFTQSVSVCVFSMQLACGAVWVSGVDALWGLPGQRSGVMCVREVRETAWRQQTCCPAQTTCLFLLLLQYFMVLEKTGILCFVSSLWTTSVFFSFKTFSSTYFYWAWILPKSVQLLWFQI